MKAKLENYSGKVFLKPLEAIADKCLDCSVYDEKEVKLCSCTSCSLWPFRFGTNPYYKRTLSAEQKQAAAERMLSVREKGSS